MGIADSVGAGSNPGQEAGGAPGSQSPRVSVVMSVYNGEAYLVEAIESILEQTFFDFEFIIVDDGSRDRTAEILDRYQDRRIVRMRHERNLGMGEAYNRAFLKARGEYIAVQDADDRSAPERLKVEVDYLRDHPDIGVVGTAFYETDARGEPITLIKPPSSDTAIRWQMLFITPLCHGTIMFRSEIVRRHGLCYEAPPPVEDYDFLIKLIQRTRAAGVPMPLYLYRRHGDSVRDRLQRETRDAVHALSRRQLARLLPRHRLSSTEIEDLNRCWYPRGATELERSSFATMLELLSAFEKQDGIDITEVRRLRREWVNRILTRRSVKDWRRLWRSGFFTALLRVDPAALVGAVLSRTLQPVRRRRRR
jgi:glycosyltransferase involved in cell wall biosynthesis